MADIDLRRAARLVTGLHESDYDAVKLVMVEVQRADRWQPFAMACAVVSRILLTKIDEAEDDEGAIALWLAAAVEQVANDGDCWWVE
jgi:hypothetical protein